MTESSPARADIADLPPAHSALPAWVFSLLTAGLIIAATWVIGGMALRQAGLIESVRLDRRVTQAGPSEAYVGPLHLSLPADALRYQSSEREGPSARVDLAVQWPDLSGIDPTTPDAPLDRVIFLTLSVSDVERDMSERLDSVYRRLFTGQGTVTPDGLVVRPLNPDAGYGSDSIVFDPNGQHPFVARCTEATETLPAACQRDINLPNGISMVYRFRPALLSQWRRLDDALITFLIRHTAHETN